MACLSPFIGRCKRCILMLQLYVVPLNKMKLDRVLYERNAPRRDYINVIHILSVFTMC